MTKKKTSGYFFSILCLIFICVSCKEYPYPPEVTKVLVQAGGNRDELIKVLEHYQGKDSLKYKAACFLIENIDLLCDGCHSESVYDVCKGGTY